MYFGPGSNGTTILSNLPEKGGGGELVHGLRLRELPDFCAEHILNNHSYTNYTNY